MRTSDKNQFKITLLQERGFVKFYIRHPSFKDRIKKHVAKGSRADYENYLVEFKSEIERYFVGKTITYDQTSSYVNFYVDRKKQSSLLFNFKDEFVDMKRKTFNRRTNCYLSSSSINSYIKAIDYFKSFLKENQKSELPEDINSSVLNDFFDFMQPLSQNYRAKLHSRLKEYLTYIKSQNGVTVDKSYIDSCFTEQYDNQETEKDDIALTFDDMNKLILLRNDFKNNKIQLPPYKTAKTIPVSLQIQQRETKIMNIKRTLDCFLFMCSVGMYVSDVNKIKMTLKNKGNLSYISYRRAKNNSYCKGIPVLDKDCFLGKTILKEYGIKSNSNFPLNLSLNNFDKNLKIISQLAGLDFMITSKMARKTFASTYYFDYRVNIGDIQMMLGHKEVRHTMHYLRIDDDEFANRIFEQLGRTG